MESVRSLHGEKCTVGCIAYVSSDIIASFSGNYTVAESGNIADRPTGTQSEIIIDDSASVRGQSVDKLEFGGAYIFQRLERLQMHRADSSDNPHLRVYYIAYLLNITFLLGTHLADEYLVVGLEIFTDCADHTHWRIVRSGSHQNVELFRKYAGQIVLGTCLTIAARDADNTKTGHGSQNTACVIYISALNSLFHRNKHHVGQKHDRPRQDADKHHVAHRHSRCRIDTYGMSGRTQRHRHAATQSESNRQRIQTPHAASHDKRFLGLSSQDKEYFCQADHRYDKRGKPYVEQFRSHQQEQACHIDQPP